jgi:protein-S-isoprenylcysteine O-methyltransferase Ste14
LGVAFGLMFDLAIPVGWLERQILPHTVAVTWLAFAITFAGCALAVWARLILGGNWSGSISLKQEHALIRTGPYRWVRHPIYSGLVLAMLGTAIGLGQIRGFCGAAVMLVAFLIKARSEDNLMHRTFGAEHDAYRATTGALLPRLR